MDTRGINNLPFEEYDAAVDWTRAAEADAVKISLPGFKREEIRVLVDNHGHLRTRGERPVAGNRWSRFQKDFQLPADCNVDGIRAKFENEMLTITLPKKSPSPVQQPAAAPLRPPPALPEPAKPSPPPRAPVPPPAVPAALPPAPSQRLPSERRPSLPRKPSVSEPAAPAPPPPVPAPAAEAVTRKKSDLATLLKPKDQEKVEEAPKKPLPPAPAAAAAATEKKDEEEEKQMEREARGKMEEDRKLLAKEEEVEGTMDMAQPRRPVSASRGLLLNVAVALVVLVGITVYVWHTLRNAAAGGGGAGDGGELVPASYSDEM